MWIILPLDLGVWMLSFDGDYPNKFSKHFTQKL